MHKLVVKIIDIYQYWQYFYIRIIKFLYKNLASLINMNNYFEQNRLILPLLLIYNILII
jgi:hypothetical protein